MRGHYDFLSDNCAGICPEALAALIAANDGFAPGYGADDVTRRAADAVRTFLQCDAEVRFVATGTAANALASALLCRPYEAVIAHEQAHIITHEMGAPNLFGQGLAIRGVAGPNGRIDPDLLRSTIASMPPNRQRPAVLSLTNSTERGTVYATSLFQLLCGIARQDDLGIHVDGARLANAVAAGFDLPAIAGSGVDVLVMGGSKAGAPGSEAIVLLNRALATDIDLRLKQWGQLASKTRFLAAPWIGLLDHGAGGEAPWVRHARHANVMARLLADVLPLPIVHPVESNCLFTGMSQEHHALLRERGWHLARVEDGSVRFVCSWATSEASIDALLGDIRLIG